MPFAASESAPGELAPSHSPRRAPRILLQGSPEPIAALNRVRIAEYARPWEEREALRDIRAACPDVVLVEGICPYLRSRAAAMLNAAQAALPPGYRLKVGTALRTLAMQQRGWDGYYQKMREAHPNWPLSALRRATNKYFAPYDQKAPPGHCTGGAVDVGLLDPEGNALDMIAPTSGWEAAYTWSDKISPEAKANRMLMVEAMLGAGFSNCRDEFWHYSWGDSAWAVRVGETECPYGWAHPPVALENATVGAPFLAWEMQTARDMNGRALHAEGECDLAALLAAKPEAASTWRVGLFWAGGVPVALRLRWPDAPADAALHLDAGENRWEPLPDVERRGDTFAFRLTPDADRVFLTPPPPPDSEPSPETA